MNLGPCNSDSLFFPVLDDFVDQTVILCLYGRKNAVAFDIKLDLFKSLARVICNDTRGHLTHTQDLFSHDPNIGRLSGRSTGRLVDKDAGMRESKAFTRCTGT